MACSSGSRDVHFRVTAFTATELFCFLELVAHRISCSLPEFPAYLRLLLFGALAPCWNLLLIRARLSRLSALKLDAYWNSCLFTLVGAHWSLLLLCVCCPLELRARRTYCLSEIRDVHFRLLTMRCDLLVQAFRSMELIAD